MAEAVVAVGLVASITQIADFSQRCLRRLKEYQEKTNKLPATFQAIQMQLPLVVIGLKAVQARAERGELPNESFHLIKRTLEACRKEIENLDKIFSHLLLPLNVSSLNKRYRAMKTLYYDHDVQQSMNILKNHIDMLMWFQISTASVDTSRLLLQDTSHDVCDPESSVEDPCKDETDLNVSPLQERNAIAIAWEKYLRLDCCTCKRGPIIRKSTRWALTAANFSSQVFSMHRPSCPYFLERRNIWKLSFNLNYTSLVFRNRLQVALSIQFGHGGIEINPKLELRGVQRDNSPAFALIFEFTDPLQTFMTVDQLGLRMRQLFEDGKASPFETNEYGETLMHVAISACPSEALEVLQTLRYLGVPLNERDSLFGRTVFRDALANSIYFESSELLMLIKYLIYEGAEDSGKWTYEDTLHLANFKNFIAIMRVSPEIAEYFNCNILQFALLRRSFSIVEKCIRERPGLVAEKNSFGHNSLHLASEWPEATKLLLSTGNESLHQPDQFGLHPISYACMFNSIKTVEILLADGCPLFCGRKMEYSNSGWDILQKNFCQDIFQVVASTLAQRRLELIRTARQFLSERTLRETIPQEETIPDASARRLIEAVVVAARLTGPEHEYRVNRSFLYGCTSREYEYRPVYHTWRGPVQGAEILFNAGFSTILGKNEHGRSPLHSPRDFQDMKLVGWFYKKRVPFAKVEDSYISEGIPNINPNVHWLVIRVSYRIFIAIRSWLDDHEEVDDDFVETLRIILSGEFAHCVDECKCPCSLAGCDPVAIFLKQLTERLAYDRNSWKRLALFLKYAQCVLVTLEAALDWNKAGPISHSFVRFTLYEILGMRHVCCHIYLGPRFSREEVDEIIENSTLLERFEILLPLAQSKWEHTSKSWTRFWRDFYLDNIATEIVDPDEMDESYMEKVTALGVRIEEERQTGHQGTWVCYFEQPAKDDSGVEKQDEQSANLIQLDHSRVVRKENFPIEDSSEPRANNSSQFVCPCYDRRKKRSEILLF